MKKYIFLSLLFMSCGGGGNHNPDVKQPEPYKILSGGQYSYISVIEVDHCHYILFDGNQKGGIVHKENCPNHK
jgi:hypothetical protein